MVRCRVKKGYLLIEVIIYILLAGIILISIMNIGIFIMRNHNKSKLELTYMTNFVQIHDRIEKLIEGSETQVFFESDKRIKVVRTNDKKESFVYFNDGRVVLKDFNNGRAITVGESKDMVIYDEPESNVFLIKYIFSDSYEIGAVYEK